MIEAELNKRLLACGFRRDEVAEPDRLPEQLILSHLVDTPSTAVELESQRWWKDRARRMDLAFHRLRASGQIEFAKADCEKARWQVVRSPLAERAAEPRPDKAVQHKQRSLF